MRTIKILRTTSLARYKIINRVISNRELKVKKDLLNALGSGDRWCGQVGPHLIIH